MICPVSNPTCTSLASCSSLGFGLGATSGGFPSADLRPKIRATLCGLRDRRADFLSYPRRTFQWWAHIAFTRINLSQVIVNNQLDDLLIKSQVLYH
jgi:hypothetical protein